MVSQFETTSWGIARQGFPKKSLVKSGVAALHREVDSTIVAREPLGRTSPNSEGLTSRRSVKEVTRYCLSRMAEISSAFRIWLRPSMSSSRARLRSSVTVRSSRLELGFPVASERFDFVRPSFRR